VKLIAHDFETTGVNAKTCGVVQSAIAIVDVSLLGDYTIVAQEVTLHHPGCLIPDGAANIHGINDQMVRGKPNFEESLPETYEQAMREFQPTAVLGYNSNQYDNVIARRLGLDTEPLVEIDLMIAARRLMSRGHLTRARLVDAYTQLTGLEPTNAHDAMADVLMTLDLIKPTMKIMGFETFPDLVGWLENPEINAALKMPFGKHKGSPLEIIPKSYLQWLSKKDDLPAELAASVKAALLNRGTA
jgi:DNA polymerase III epsilon subunit-like protein